MSILNTQRHNQQLAFLQINTWKHFRVVPRLCFKRGKVRSFGYQNDYSVLMQKIKGFTLDYFHLERWRFLEFGESLLSQEHSLIWVTIALTTPAEGMWMLGIIPFLMLLIRWHSTTPSASEASKSSGKVTFSRLSILCGLNNQKSNNSSMPLTYKEEANDDKKFAT